MKTLVLIIKKADGSTYWTEYFNSMALLNAWLSVEQTRPYWDKSFTTQIVDNTPAPPTAADIAAAAALKTQNDTLKLRLAALAAQPDMTASDIKETLMKFMKLKLLNGEFS